jgi:hypothetical protein
MGETNGETGAQHESADAGGAPEQATPGPVTDQTGGAGTAGAESVSDASESTSESGDAGGSKSKAAVVAAGTVAGVAGGIAVAARDTRRRVVGIPIGKRSRFQRGASVVADTAGTVVEKVREPAKRVGSRFSRDQ